MTHAQSAAAILLRNGISSALVKPPVALGRGSCAYGLVLSSNYLPVALQYIGKTSCKVLGVYEQNNGCWREVLL